jgi:putative PIG3 family NAD(P)H quinone oxidoreductase
MQAIEIAQPGGPDVLRLVTRPTPRPGVNEVLIRIAAAGVNYPDTLQRRGKYALPPGTSDIPGLEVAGTIEQLGDGVDSWRVGDRVCALLSGGGYAEYCVAPVPQCLPIPDGMDFVSAAAMPETYFTVWTNVFEDGRLGAGQTFLVHGGTSGIGTTAIQLAHAFGARVFATAGSPEKCEACVRLGAESAVNYRVDDFVAAIRPRTPSERGVDLILDMVGGDYVARNLDLLAPRGHLVQIAFLKTPKVELDLSVIMRKRLTFSGSLLRPRTIAEKGAIAEALRLHVWPLLARGVARPIIHATFPLAQASEAHRQIEAGGHIGKIVLKNAER